MCRHHSFLNQKQPSWVKINEMKNYLIIILAFSFAFSVNSQDLRSDSPINWELTRLNTDLSYLKEVLYTSHPAPFKYISRDSLNNLFDLLEFKNGDRSVSFSMD